MWTRAAESSKHYSLDARASASVRARSQYATNDDMPECEFGQGREYLDLESINSRPQPGSGKSKKSSAKYMARPAGALPWRPTGRAP